ncbi:MAG: DUF3253 domain-containing protein [Verrucomicrobiota bacterium]
MKNEISDLLRKAILDLLARRKPGATICPSEAARLVAPDGWRDLMELTRRVALVLVNEGLVDICQKGNVVDPSAGIKGPVRLRLKMTDRS